MNSKLLNALQAVLVFPPDNDIYQKAFQFLSKNLQLDKLDKEVLSYLYALIPELQQIAGQIKQHTRTRYSRGRAIGSSRMRRKNVSSHARIQQIKALQEKLKTMPNLFDKDVKSGRNSYFYLQIRNFLAYLSSQGKLYPKAGKFFRTVIRQYLQDEFVNTGLVEIATYVLLYRRPELRSKKDKMQIAKFLSEKSKDVRLNMKQNVKLPLHVIKRMLQSRERNTRLQGRFLCEELKIDIGLSSMLPLLYDGLHTLEKAEDLVIVIGPTRSGKSTTINCMTGTEYQLARDYLGLQHQLIPKHGQVEKLRSGHSSDSETLYPQLISQLVKDIRLTLCDTPGFEDTNTEDQATIAALGIPAVIHKAKHVRAIVVVLEYELTELNCNNRIPKFLEIARILSNLIDNPRELLPNLNFDIELIDGDLPKNKRHFLQGGERKQITIYRDKESKKWHICSNMQIKSTKINSEDIQYAIDEITKNAEMVGNKIVFNKENKKQLINLKHSILYDDMCYKQYIAAKSPQILFAFTKPKYPRRGEIFNPDLQVEQLIERIKKLKRKVFSSEAREKNMEHLAVLKRNMEVRNELDGCFAILEDIISAGFENYKVSWLRSGISGLLGLSGQVKMGAVEEALKDIEEALKSDGYSQYAIQRVIPACRTLFAVENNTWDLQPAVRRIKVAWRREIRQLDSQIKKLKNTIKQHEAEKNILELMNPVDEHKIAEINNHLFIIRGFHEENTKDEKDHKEVLLETLRMLCLEGSEIPKPHFKFDIDSQEFFEAKHFINQKSEQLNRKFCTLLSNKNNIDSLRTDIDTLKKDILSAKQELSTIFALDNEEIQVKTNKNLQKQLNRKEKKLKEKQTNLKKFKQKIVEKTKKIEVITTNKVPIDYCGRIYRSKPSFWYDFWRWFGWQEEKGYDFNLSQLKNNAGFEPSIVPIEYVTCSSIIRSKDKAKNKPKIIFPQSEQHANSTFEQGAFQNITFSSDGLKTVCYPSGVRCYEIQSNVPTPFKKTGKFIVKEVNLREGKLKLSFIANAGEMGHGAIRTLVLPKNIPANKRQIAEYEAEIQDYQGKADTLSKEIFTLQQEIKADKKHLSMLKNFSEQPKKVEKIKNRVKSLVQRVGYDKEKFIEDTFVSLQEKAFIRWLMSTNVKDLLKFSSLNLDALEKVDVDKKTLCLYIGVKEESRVNKFTLKDLGMNTADLRDYLAGYKIFCGISGDNVGKVTLTMQSLRTIIQDVFFERYIVKSKFRILEEKKQDLSMLQSYFEELREEVSDQLPEIYAVDKTISLFHSSEHSMRTRELHVFRDYWQRLQEEKILEIHYRPLSKNRLQRVKDQCSTGRGLLSLGIHIDLTPNLLKELKVKIQQRNNFERFRSVYEHSAAKECFIGRLPNNEIITVNEFEADADNNCGFYVLGIGRNKLADVLDAAVTDTEIRTMLSEEIEHSLLTNDLGRAATAKSRMLHERYVQVAEMQVRLEAAANELLQELDQDHKRRGMQKGIDVLVNLLLAAAEKDKENVRIPGMIDRLRAYEKDEQSARHDIKDYVCSAEMYSSYVRALRSSSAWIGCQSMLAVAKLLNISVYIWHKKTDGSKELDLYRYYEAQRPENIVHALHTSGFTHFNLLAQVSQNSKKIVSEDKEIVNVDPNAKIDTYKALLQKGKYGAVMRELLTKLSNPSESVLARHVFPDGSNWLHYLSGIKVASTESEMRKRLRETIQSLMRSGVSPHARNKVGQTAYHLIPQKDSVGVRNLFPKKDAFIGVEKQILEMKDFFEGVRQGKISKRCLILEGPAGCGKTVLMKRIAEECGFIYEQYVRAASEDQFVNQSETRIRKCFSDAKRKNTYVCLVMDEIDSICPGENARSSNAIYVQRDLQTIQEEISNLVQEKAKVVVIGATNFYAKIAEPIRNRAGTPIVFYMPNKLQRKKMIENFLQDQMLEDPNIIDTLAEATVGWSPRLLYSYLEGVVLEAEKKDGEILNEYFIAPFDAKCKEITDKYRSKATLVPPRLKLNKGEDLFAHLVGVDSGFRKSLQKVTAFLNNPRAYLDRLADMSCNIILYGAPGTGKSTFAKTVANHVNSIFININGGEYKEYGASSRLKDVFHLAKQYERAVIFIDEIDAITMPHSPTRELLQTEMEGFAKTSNTLVIVGATNYRDRIAAPILSRFSCIEVPKPKRKAREELWKYFLQKPKNVLFSEELQNLDMVGKTLADASNGMTPRDIKKVITDVVLELTTAEQIAGTQKKLTLQILLDEIKKLPLEKNEVEIDEVGVIKQGVSGEDYESDDDEFLHLLKSKLNLDDVDTPKPSKIRIKPNFFPIEEIKTEVQKQETYEAECESEGESEEEEEGEANKVNFKRR